MANTNTYLIYSEPFPGSGHYYTFSLALGLQDIGIVADFTKGFGDDTLALITNNIYTTLNNASLQIQSTDSAYIPTATITPVPYGTLQTTPITAIDLKGYSGIDKITVNGTGGKYAISFDNRVTWKTKVADPCLVTLLHFDNDFTDEKGRVWTPDATLITIDSAQSKFGGKSVHFLEYRKLSTPNTQDFNFGSGDFTIKWWQHRTASANPSGELVFVSAISSTVGALVIGQQGSNMWLKVNDTLAVWGWTQTLNTWTHYALSRKNGIFYCFQDGALVATNNTLVGTAINYNAAQPIGIGSLSNTYIDDFSVYKGYGISEAFAVPTSPTLAISDWVDVLPSEIDTKGMSSSTLNSLTPSIFSTVFKPTALDFMVSLDSASSLTSLSVALPPNAGPAIRNIKVTPDIMHRENVTLSADLADAEGDAMEYRILLNAAEFQTWEACTEKINVVFPDHVFIVGATSVKIEARDSRGVVTNQEIFVTRIDTAPAKITGVLSGKILRATLGDADNDDISYRIKVNEAYKNDWSVLAQSPIDVYYEISRDDILFGEINTITVEYKDSLGISGIDYTEEFVGSYYGLMFADLEGNYYSNDLGEVIKKLNFGTLIASQTSIPKEVQIINRCGFDLKNTHVSTDPEISRKVSIEMCATDTPFIASSDLYFGSLQQNERKSFFVRIVTTKSSFGGGDFNINAIADPV